MAVLLKEAYTVDGAFVYALIIFVMGMAFGYMLKKHEPKKRGKP